MTEIVFKPEPAPIEGGRGLYRAYMNKQPLGLLFRAKTAGEADRMLQFLFTEQTHGKTLFVNPALFEPEKEAKDDKTKRKEEKCEDACPSGAESDRPDDPPNRGDAAT